MPTTVKRTGQKTFFASSDAEQYALRARPGDLCIRTDQLNLFYFRNGNGFGDTRDWDTMVGSATIPPQVRRMWTASDDAEMIALPDAVLGDTCRRLDSSLVYMKMETGGIITDWWPMYSKISRIKGLTLESSAVQTITDNGSTSEYIFDGDNYDLAIYDMSASTGARGMSIQASRGGALQLKVKHHASVTRILTYNSYQDMRFVGDPTLYGNGNGGKAITLAGGANLFTAFSMTWDGQHILVAQSSFF
jgi:hypothetical protein